jgi:transcriptional regulator with XRE-family HTH domain
MLLISDYIRLYRNAKKLTSKAMAARIGMNPTRYSTKEKNDKFTQKDLYVILENLDLKFYIKEK